MIVRLLTVLMLALGMLALIGDKESLSQPSKKFSVKPEPGNKPEAQGVDVGLCLKCHKMSPEEAADPDYDSETRKLIINNEIPTWAGTDLHRNAYLNIKPDDKGGDEGKGNLASKMEQILKRTPSRAKVDYKVTQAAECLVCHAVDTSIALKGGAAADVSPMLLDNLETPRFDVRYGISCEACHGIVSIDWNTVHAVPTWREKLPTYKLTEGQIDLRDPVVRAEKCASCHVGSAKEHKWVTHEMYAAGHPPLPAFEVADYSSEQPTHYHQPRDTAYFKEELQKEKDGKLKKGVPSLESRFHYREGESAVARQLAIGAVASLRSTLGLYLHDVDAQPMLDFAHFDCAACHHDLKTPSERQNRKGGITGRPLMKAQTDLIDVILEHAGNKELRGRFKTELEELQAAFTARPFGDNDKVKAASEKLNKTVTEILAALKPIVYDQKKTLALYNLLHARLQKMAADQAYIDHDSAQQMAWALLNLHRELDAMKVDAPDWKQSEARLKETIGLLLREPVTDKPLASVESRLRERLKKQYDFSSKAFLNAFVPEKGR